MHKDQARPPRSANVHAADGSIASVQPAPKEVLHNVAAGQGGNAFDRTVQRVLAGIAAAIIVLIPLHATMTVWLASALGHYTALRLWKEFLLVLLVMGAGYLCVKDAALRRRLARSPLVWLIGAYLAVQVLWGVAAYARHAVGSMALGYGWISDTRFLVFFLVVWIVAAYVPALERVWTKLVFWPAAVVVVFGLLQYFVLPYDFLKHLGYSSATIFPYEDINHNTHYLRVMSTLRGANPLGVYLIAVLSVAGAYLIYKRVWRPAGQRTVAVWGTLLLGAGAAVALVLSFSRGAWIGMAAGVSVLGWSALRTMRQRVAVAGAGLVVAVAAFGAVLGLRGSTTFQNIFFHTQDHSAVATTSDQGHATALQSGLRDMLREPLGRGPGTAGPASVYNTGHPGRIAENYFVQVAQETGWLGLALFAAINLLLARMLWRSRAQPLALGLLAALAGISVASLFSHTWSDDTLAYFWWGLAAIACAVTLRARDAEAGH